MFPFSLRRTGGQDGVDRGHLVAEEVEDCVNLVMVAAVEDGSGEQEQPETEQEAEAVNVAACGHDEILVNLK